jgi:hypothetical protein
MRRGDRRHDRVPFSDLVTLQTLESVGAEHEVFYVYATQADLDSDILLGKRFRWLAIIWRGNFEAVRQSGVDDVIVR